MEAKIKAPVTRPDKVTFGINLGQRLGGTGRFGLALSIIVALRAQIGKSRAGGGKIID